MHTHSEVERRSVTKRTRLVALLVMLSTDGARSMRAPQPATPVPPPLSTQSVPPAADASAPAGAATTPKLTPRAALSVHAVCNARDESGYTESIKLAVEGGRVDQLEVKLDTRRRGSCQFRLADFHQTRTTPHVELHARAGSACSVRMWEQGDRFTVAFSDCQEKCTRGAFDYVWPVELNSRTGACL